MNKLFVYLIKVKFTTKYSVSKYIVHLLETSEFNLKVFSFVSDLVYCNYFKVFVNVTHMCSLGFTISMVKLDRQITISRAVTRPCLLLCFVVVVFTCFVQKPFFLCNFFAMLIYLVYHATHFVTFQHYFYYSSFIVITV